MNTETSKDHKDPRAAGAPWFTTHMVVADMQASIAFYEAALGLKLGTSLPGPGGVPVHAEMTGPDDMMFMLAPEDFMGAPGKCPATTGTPSPVNLFYYVSDVDAMFAQAKGAGAKVIEEPADQFWGDRTAMFEDPNGYRWMIATNVAEFDPSKVPSFE